MNRPTIFIFMTLLCSVSSSVYSQTPLSPGFTYQGHLNQNGVPVDGAVNLRFSLWDAATNGAQLGSDQLLADVPVAGGVFAVTLNEGGEFGPDSFNGGARWLEIEVCNNAACNSSTTLVPRQPVTGTPYALNAISVPWDGLTGVPEGFADNVDNSADSVWGVNGTSVFYNAGNVGIGTTTPAQPVEIANGRMRFSSNLGDIEFVEAADLIAYATTENPAGDLHAFRVDAGTGLKRVLTVLVDGEVGVRTPQPVAGLHVFKDPVPPGGTLALEGSTSVYISLFPNGTHNGRMGLIGYASPISPHMTISNVSPGGAIMLVTQNSQVFAAGGEENLRIVRGVVDGQGNIIVGSGFTSERNSIGRYTVTFNPPFTGPPAVTATLHFGNIAHSIIMTDGVAATNAKLIISDLDIHLVDQPFHFIAIGPR